jgi:hypothetical protein
MTNDPMPKSTFSSFSAAFADEDRLGRYGTDKPPSIIVGTELQTNYPGAGNVDPVPDEPLISTIEEMTPVGTQQEIQKSLERLRKAEKDDPGAA